MVQNPNTDWRPQHNVNPELADPMEERRISMSLWNQWSRERAFKDLEFIDELTFTAKMFIAPGRYSKQIKFKII